MREKTRVEEIVREIAQKDGAEVLDFTYNRQDKRCFVKIVLGGLEPDYNINIQTITAVTKDLKRDPEFDEIVPEDYRLEVTSPGSDYPMRTMQDFTRNIGQKVRLKHDNLEVKTPVNGKLIEVDQEGVYLNISDEKIFFRFDQIEFGKVVY